MKHVNVCLCGAGGVGPIILQKSAMLSAVLWIPSCPCYPTVLSSGFFITTVSSQSPVDLFPNA